MWCRECSTCGCCPFYSCCSIWWSTFGRERRLGLACEKWQSFCWCFANHPFRTCSAREGTICVRLPSKEHLYGVLVRPSWAQAWTFWQPERPAGLALGRMPAPEPWRASSGQSRKWLRPWRDQNHLQNPEGEPNQTRWLGHRLPISWSDPSSLARLFAASSPEACSSSHPPWLAKNRHTARDSSQRIYPPPRSNSRNRFREARGLWNRRRLRRTRSPKSTSCLCTKF